MDRVPRGAMRCVVSGLAATGARCGLTFGGSTTEGTAVRTAQLASSFLMCVLVVCGAASQAPGMDK